MWQRGRGRVQIDQHRWRIFSDTHTFKTLAHFFQHVHCIYETGCGMQLAAEWKTQSWDNQAPIRHWNLTVWVPILTFRYEYVLWTCTIPSVLDGWAQFRFSTFPPCLSPRKYGSGAGWVQVCPKCTRQNFVSRLFPISGPLISALQLYLNDTNRRARISRKTRLFRSRSFILPINGSHGSTMNRYEGTTVGVLSVYSNMERFDPVGVS